VTDQKRAKKTVGAHRGNPLTTAAKAIGTRLGQLAIEASLVAAAGQQAALLPAVTTKKPTKKAKKGRKTAASKTGLKK
jgi:hypothetical protein